VKFESQPRPRRRFLKDVSAATAGVILQQALSAAETNSSPAPKLESKPGEIIRRKFGRTNEQLSIMGLGGHTLALAPDEAESIRIVHEALAGGINFMDNAWDYHDGRAEVIMGKALKGRRDQAFLMTKCCAHKRGQTRKAALEMLEESLVRLQTDRLDLWMLHELTTPDQVAAAFAPDGPLEGLLAAKKQGKVRYLGFTGHQSAAIHLAMLKHDFPFDAVLMPVNAFEPERKGFRTEVLPELQKRELGVLGIKALGGTPARVLQDGRYTAEQLIRFSLSQPITTQIVGMSSLQNLRDNLAIARAFKPMKPEEMEKLMAKLSSENAAQAYAQYQLPGYRDGRGRV
jgi:aryl-alcohol dehydrogenase-like predicted oxidoreductase